MANEEKKQEDLQKYLGAILYLYSSYHNHKESMAHLALAAQIALACAVFSGKWLPHCYLHQIFLLFAVIILWFALYLYAGWEMWLRRKAATMNNAIIRAKGKLIRQEYGSGLDEGKVQTRPWDVKFYKWVWFPWFCIYTMKDVFEKSEFPERLMYEIKESISEPDKHLDRLEVGSWILSLCILAVYILKFIGLTITCDLVHLMNSCNGW